MAANDGILVLTTGGTFDKIYFDTRSSFEVGDSVVGELLAQAKVSCSFEVRELLRKDSLELTDQDRALIRTEVVEADSNRIVITHGTDTMTETAAQLRGIPGKTIVLTGALAPARFAESDAPFNLGLAFGAVQSMEAGVYIAMNGTVFVASGVRKDADKNLFVET